jgi:hypothetical protein
MDANFQRNKHIGGTASVVHNREKHRSVSDRMEPVPPRNEVGGFAVP